MLFVIFWNVWMKKWVEMCIMLFKNWKCVIFQVLFSLISKLVFYYVLISLVKLGFLILLLQKKSLYIYVCVCVHTCSMYSENRWSWLIKLLSVLSIKACWLLSLFSLFFFSFLRYFSHVPFIRSLNAIESSLFLLP